MSPDTPVFDMQPDELRISAGNRPRFWIALGISGLIWVGVGMLVGGQWLPMPSSLSPTALQVLEIGVMVGPGLLWLGLMTLLVYRQGDLLRAMWLVWLLTAALYLVTVQPLVHQVFQVDAWATMSWTGMVLADFFIVAPLEMLLVYLVLWWGIYPSLVLRQRVDGVLFGVASGLGVAGVVGLLLLWSGEGGSLAWDVMRAGQAALAYTALGAWLGYFLAQAKFKRHHALYLPAGFLLVVALHTLFFTLSRGLASLNLFLPDYSGLGATASFALLNILVLAWRLHRSNQDVMRMATKMELMLEQHRPRSLLGDVVPLADEVTTAPVPPPPPPARVQETSEPVDELASLKRSWDALIAEQEGKDESV